MSSLPTDKHGLYTCGTGLVCHHLSSQGKTGLYSYETGRQMAIENAVANFSDLHSSIVLTFSTAAYPVWDGTVESVEGDDGTTQNDKIVSASTGQVRHGMGWHFSLPTLVLDNSTGRDEAFFIIVQCGSKLFPNVISRWHLQCL